MSSGTVNQVDILNLSLSVVLKLKFRFIKGRTRPYCLNVALIDQGILIYTAIWGIVRCVFEDEVVVGMGKEPVRDEVRRRHAAVAVSDREGGGSSRWDGRSRLRSGCGYSGFWRRRRPMDAGPLATSSPTQGSTSRRRARDSRC